MHLGIVHIKCQSFKERRDPKFVTNCEERKRRDSKGLSINDITLEDEEGVWQIVTVQTKNVFLYGTLVTWGGGLQNP